MKHIILLLATLLVSVAAKAQSPTFTALLKAAERGDVSAEIFIGKCYLKGNFVDESVEQAYHWFEKAAKQDDPEAQYCAAFCAGRLGNFQDWFAWLAKSAENDYNPAKVELAVCIQNEYPVKAFNYVYSAATQKYEPAYLVLAECYLRGFGTTPDIERAYEYSYKALRTEKDKAKAMLYIAYCFDKKKDYSAAFTWYEKAVKADLPQAYNDISYMYAMGKGTKKDFAKAYEMVDIAIQKEPQNPNFYDRKGEIFLMEGKTEQAQKMWNKVLSLDSDAEKRKDPLALAMVNSVDNNIPESPTKADKTFALIIANEDYKRVTSVPFAKNDGRVFAEYCKKTLGIPNKNVYYLENATFGDMKYHINLMKSIAKAYNGNAKIIFYYSGHGIPDEVQKSGYILPIDGYGNDATSGFSLKALYSDLSSIPAASVLILLDACFSGAQRDGSMLETARGVVINPKTEIPSGNIVVFSASNGNETAYPYTAKKHGLFTYYLLKKIQETCGDTTLEELGNYLIEQVSQKSIDINKKSQTPTITPSLSFGESWRRIRMK